MIRHLVAALALLCATPAFAGPHVRVEQGRMEGRETDGLDVFKGVPYAAPPVGDLRWRAPQPAPAWEGVRQAAEDGPSCMQTALPNGTGPWTPEFFPHNAFSEDCLYLNIWTQNADRRDLRPIMLWIPGGGFRNGGAAVPLYDGGALAREGVVVVTMNYRLGAFGFLAHEALPAEPDGTRGNYGLRDAIAALRWLHANAAAFGGDANRITIAGQSAGGALVNLLMAAPEARGLFARAIVQSSPLGAGPMPDAAAAESAAARFSETLSVTDVVSLLELSAEDVLRASDTIGFRPHVDGVLIPDDPARLLAQGRMADVPLLAGITAHESSTRFDLAAYNQFAASFGAEEAAFRTLYPATTDAEALESGLNAVRDRMLAGLERMAATRARIGQADTELYLWRRAEPGPDAAQHRAFHSSELVYMFGAFAKAPGRTFAIEDQMASRRIVSAWARFVKGGHAWQFTQPKDKPILILGDETLTPRPEFERFDSWVVAHPEKRALFDRSFEASGAFVFRP